MHWTAITAARTGPSGVCVDAVNAVSGRTRGEAIDAGAQAAWSLALVPYRCAERTAIYAGASLAITAIDLAITIAAVVLWRDLTALDLRKLICAHHVMPLLRGDRQPENFDPVFLHKPA